MLVRVVVWRRYTIKEWLVVVHAGIVVHAGWYIMVLLEVVSLSGDMCGSSRSSEGSCYRLLAASLVRQLRGEVGCAEEQQLLDGRR